MHDLFVVLIVLALTALSLLYIAGCDRLHPEE
jgi:hypothetical protein